MSVPKYLRGSTQHCPKCGSSRVVVDPSKKIGIYGPGLAVCPNCATVWEPFAPEQIWDTSDPHCSFREPCNNCAFRPSSHEQQDRAKWKELIDNLKCGASFYCHKGVPIDAEGEHSFAYPQRTITATLDGQAVTTKVHDTTKLRLCRGYLNALEGLNRAREREIKAGTLDVLSIAGYPEDDEGVP